MRFVSGDGTSRASCFDDTFIGGRRGERNMLSAMISSEVKDVIVVEENSREITPPHARPMAQSVRRNCRRCFASISDAFCHSNRTRDVSRSSDITFDTRSC